MDLKVRDEIDSPECIKCLDCTACKHVDFKFTMRYGFNKNKGKQPVPCGVGCGIPPEAA